MNQPGHSIAAADVLRMLRPAHWIKNFFVFAALVFARRLADPAAWAAAAAAFVGFCLLSSAIYVINDLADVDEDRAHPSKRARPIAAGRVARGPALIVAAICLVLGAGACAWVNTALLVVGLILVALNLLYTFGLKRMILVDVMCIALGFVIRAFAGGVAVGVPLSLWLLVCTFTLCLFLGFGKRRAEVAELAGDDANGRRVTLSHYTVPLLDQLLSISAGVAIVTYILYTLDPRTLQRLGTPYMFFTIPLVIYCFFRYAMLVEAGRIDGPTEAVTRDRPFSIGLVLWAILAAVLVTWGPAIQRALEGGRSRLLQN